MIHAARRNVRCASALVCSLLFIFGVLSLPARGFASSPQSEYQKIQKEIKTKKEKLEQVKRRELSILADIEETNKQMKIIENDLQKYRSRLASTGRRISQVEREILAAKDAVERHRMWIKRKLRTIHKYGRNSDVVLLLLSSQDISQLIRTGKNLQYITAREHESLVTYQDSLANLQEKEKQLILLKKELLANQSKVIAEEEALSAKQKSKKLMLAAVKQEKSSLSQMLREMEEASNRLLEIIKKSEKGDLFTGRGFAALKGSLPWPVEGRVVMPFGSQKDPEFNTPVFKSGTFIESSPESVAKAVHEGKVVFAEWFKGYGQLVIINHGEGYHSLYGSLAEIFTKVGDIIKKKQVIGRVGNSGLANVPGLYFELRYKGKPLNPMQWLQRR